MRPTAIDVELTPTRSRNSATWRTFSSVREHSLRCRSKLWKQDIASCIRVSDSNSPNRPVDHDFDSSSVVSVAGRSGIGRRGGAICCAVRNSCQKWWLPVTAPMDYLLYLYRPPMHWAYSNSMDLVVDGVTKVLERSDVTIARRSFK